MGLSAAFAARAERLRRRVRVLEATFVAAGRPVPAEAPIAAPRYASARHRRVVEKSDLLLTLPSPRSDRPIFPDPPLLTTWPGGPVPSGSINVLVPDPLEPPIEEPQALTEDADFLVGLDMF